MTTATTDPAAAAPATGAVAAASAAAAPGVPAATLPTPLRARSGPESGVRLRAVLADIPAYRPGRRPAPGQVLARLASNEQPFGPLPGVAEAVAQAAADVHRYPDPAATALVDALATHAGLPSEQVAVGCGSVALIATVLSVVAEAGDEVAFNWRSFEAYPVFARLTGARVVTAPLTAEHGLDLQALADRVTPATRAVFVCTPNNPTGAVVSAADLDRFCAAVPPDTLVVVDEAYAEFVTDPAAARGLPLLARYGNVAVLRTFSKAYGLAGLRVGWLAGPAPLVAAVRAASVPFAVNTVAQAAALASLAAADELAARVAATTAERDRVRAALDAAGVPVAASGGNFVWVPAGAAATAVSAALEADGVLTRAFDGDGVRVTLGTPADNDRAVAALQACYAPAATGRA